MRVVQNPQMQIGEVDVSRIVLDPKSRDDIPQILRGLQHLHQNPNTRAQLFALLESDLAPTIDKRTGRPGMTLWSIFVCGVIRLDLNIDYDRLHELANQHNTLRQMLGHGQFDPTAYHYQTLKDNVRLFTPELLDKINQIVVDLLKLVHGLHNVLATASVYTIYLSHQKSYPRGKSPRALRRHYKSCSTAAAKVRSLTKICILKK